MPGILDGVRVLSFTAGVAGPNAARVLAQCGAEVIKVESRGGGLDSFRYFSTADDLDTSTRFIEANLNVLSVQLNLKEPTGTGVRLAREIAARCDVVLDNFRADVLPRLGLGPDDLRAIRPDLVVLKMPGMGMWGPRAGYGTWGSTLNAMSGMTYLWNHPSADRPIGAQGVYPDYVTAALAPTVVLAALLRREATGQGATIDFAQVEAVAYLLGVSYLEADINQREPTPVGNDWRLAAPHNTYPCRGDDRWCVIAVETDAQWRALCQVLGQSELADDEHYSTLHTRRLHLADIDELLSRWTERREAEDVVEQLQAQGVPAGVVQNGLDLFNDSHLRSRNFIQSVEHATLGTIPLAALPLHLSDPNAFVPPRRAPMLGEHNAYVLCDLLGYSEEQLATWEAEQVVW